VANALIRVVIQWEEDTAVAVVAMQVVEEEGKRKQVGFYSTAKNKTKGKLSYVVSG
jgi:uncharacterized protein YfaP (DUF2135 family)